MKLINSLKTVILSISLFAIGIGASERRDSLAPSRPKISIKKLKRKLKSLIATFDKALVSYKRCTSRRKMGLDDLEELFDRSSLIFSALKRYGYTFDGRPESIDEFLEEMHSDLLNASWIKQKKLFLQAEVDSFYKGFSSQEFSKGALESKLNSIYTIVQELASVEEAPYSGQFSAVSDHMQSLLDSIPDVSEPVSYSPGPFTVWSEQENQSEVVGRTIRFNEEVQVKVYKVEMPSDVFQDSSIEQLADRSLASPIDVHEVAPLSIDSAD